MFLGFDQAFLAYAFSTPFVLTSGAVWHVYPGLVAWFSSLVFLGFLTSLSPSHK